MGRFLTPLLAASVLVPATAVARDRGYHGPQIESERGPSPERKGVSERSAERDSSSSERPHRAEPVRGVERAGGGLGVVRMERADRPNRIGRGEPTIGSQSVDQPRRIGPAERPAEIERVNRPARVRRGASDIQTIEPAQQVQNAGRTGNDIVDGRRATAREQQLRRDRHPAGESSWSGYRDGSRDRDRRWDGDRDRNHRWSSDWRRDHRYDWRSYRIRYGSLYRLGRYNDPYGWGYRRFSIGFNLRPSYYGSSFWLNDPWRYRLPPAYWPYRWVRYFDDALLVNIYTGQVVDVINNFFW